VTCFQKKAFWAAIAAHTFRAGLSYRQRHGTPAVSSTVVEFVRGKWDTCQQLLGDDLRRLSESDVLSALQSRIPPRVLPLR